jgi:Protein of unknown function (DUF2971)
MNLDDAGVGVDGLPESRLLRSLGAAAPDLQYTPPKQLYRFRSFSDLVHAERELTECLTRCKVYCSSPKNFNDRYDCAPFIQLGDRNSARSAVNELWEVSSVTDFTHHRRLQLDAYSRFLTEDDFRLWMQAEAKKMFDNSFDLFSCACFTSNPQSMAMWYHYANQYAGVCFEFSLPEEIPEDIVRIIFSNPENRLRPIVYGESRPNFDPLDVYLAYVASGELALSMLFQQEIQDVMQKGYFMKSSDWDYEGEIRLLARGQSLYRPIYPYRPTGIILGPDVKSEVVSLVSSWATESGVRVYRAELAHESYGITWR